MNNTIVQLISEKKYHKLRDIMIELNPADIALIFEELDNIEVAVKLFRILPKDLSVDVFAYMSPDTQKSIVISITDREVKHIIDELFLDDAIDFLEEMPASFVKKVLDNADKDTRGIINQFLNYPENSAGSIMTIEYTALKKEMTVQAAIQHIRSTGIDKETIQTCYVINEKRELLGTISLRKLILSNDSDIINDLMDVHYISVTTKDDREAVAMIFKKYDLLSLPVVDNERRLVGIITIDDIVHVIDDENTEDFEKMAAIQPLDKEYLKTSTFVLARHRVVWLLVLMISATFTGSIIKHFEDVLAKVVILAAFIPMLMDTGGNAGSQSATLIIRGLALGEIKISDFLRIVWKEARVSILVGVTLAVFNFLRIYLFEKTPLLIAVTVCSTLVVTIFLAKVIGGILPIVAKKLKFDPAMMAAPLITTIVDAMSLATYFTLASVLLKIQT